MILHPGYHAALPVEATELIACLPLAARNQAAWAAGSLANVTESWRKWTRTTVAESRITNHEELRGGVMPWRRQRSSVAL